MTPAPPLDTLYGAGTAQGFAAAVNISAIVPGVTQAVEEQLERDGSVWLRVRWTQAGAPVGHIKMVCFPRYVDYEELRLAEAFTGKGIYTRMIRGLHPLFKNAGVRAFGARPESARAEYVLALGGFSQQPFAGERRFVARFDLAADRMQEYRAWVEAGQPAAAEPAWHAALAAAPVPGEAAY